MSEIPDRFGGLTGPKRYFRDPEVAEAQEREYQEALANQRYALDVGPIEAPRRGRRPAAPASVVDAYSAERLCELLIESHGDLTIWLEHFNVTIAQRQALMTRTYLILSEPGNEIYRDRWNRILQSFKEAQIAMVEREALTNLKKLPDIQQKDKEGNLIPLAIKDYAQLYNLFAGDMKAVSMQRAKREDKTTDATTTQAAKTIEHLERAKARGRNEA